MRRTNIYLNESQLGMLRALGAARGEAVATLVRRAIDEWLRSQGAREVDEEEWQRRFDALMDRRRATAKRLRVRQADVDRDVAAAVREVRAPGARRR